MCKYFVNQVKLFYLLNCPVVNMNAAFVKMQLHYKITFSLH
jgi:hypothetical protein